MAKTDKLAIAPGARVQIRDEEWLVRSVKGSNFGGQAVQVIGLSELVRNKESIFLSDLDEIQVLRPEDTKLVADDSPQYRRSRLYLDALLRRSPATESALQVGHRGAMRRADYQLEPASKALSQLRPRILIADGVGLGKTIEVGVLLSELIQRGRGDRILVVALKSILSQFQKELWARFTIPLVRLDSVGIQRVQSKIPSNMNPFYYFDRAIISIDTLKRDDKYRKFLEDCRWDVIVVDECQHIAERGTGSQRARLGKLLARTTDALVLTSATPHDGRPESFASLMNLLEPTAIANAEDFSRDEVEDLFIRRFKKDVAHQVSDSFNERRLELVQEDASPAENATFDRLATLSFKTIARSRGGKGALFRTLLLKAFLSSPAACVATLDQRLKHKDMQDLEDEDVQHDYDILHETRDLAQAVGDKQFSKLQRLLTRLRQLGFDQTGNEERVVIFSERVATLEYLHETLQSELGLGANQIEIFHGTLDDQKQQGLVESFGTKSTDIRILLASDAAAEGINLHYYCHRLIHFDLPWSIITLEQRNGRIDRFGQSEQPELTYLLTVPGDPKLKGDLRVLERLIEKEDAAHKNLGDVAWLMNLHDAEEEEARIVEGIEKGEAADSIIPDDAGGTDFMDLLMGGDGGGSASSGSLEVEDPLRLIPNDLDYAREAFNEILETNEKDHFEPLEHLDGFRLVPPDDLMRRFDYLPPELRKTDDDSKRTELQLTADRQRVMDSLDESRQDERKWPEWQLFWEQHPVAEWLDDRVLAKFGRHEAPVLRLPTGVGADERIVLFQGTVSNLRSQPTLVEWFGVRFRGDEVEGVESLEEIKAATGLAELKTNPGGGLPESLTSELQALLPSAVEKALDHMKERRLARAEEIRGPLSDGLRQVKAWQKRSLAEIDAERESKTVDGKLRKDRAKDLDARQREVEERYAFRREWIDQGMRTAELPYLRVAAVLIAQEAR